MRQRRRRESIVAEGNSGRRLQGAESTVDRASLESLLRSGGGSICREGVTSARRLCADRQLAPGGDPRPELNHAGLKGVADELRDVAHAKLAQKIRPMGLDGRNTDPEISGDFFAGAP